MTTTAARYHAECVAAARAAKVSGICKTCWDQGTTRAGTLDGLAIRAEIAAYAPWADRAGERIVTAQGRAGTIEGHTDQAGNPYVDFEDGSHYAVRPEAIRQASDCVQCDEHAGAEQSASHRFTPALAVGDGVTLRFHTDAHAYTVTAVSASGKTATIQRDKATLDPAFKADFRPGGFVGHVANQGDQRWTFERDPEGSVRKVRATRRGWESAGQRVTPGRSEFFDYNF
jgi:hypothetical protein